MHRRHALKSLAAVTGVGLAAERISASPEPGTTAAQTSRRAARRFRPPYIECADGARLAYRDYGTGSPMLFVAPWALSSGWWDYQITHLTGQALRCITYDRRGHGRSSDPGAGYDFDTLADDLAAVIDQLDLRAVVLVGHSLGAAEVVRYLTRHGARRVSRIVLVAPTTPFLLRTADNPLGIESAVLERARARFLEDAPERLSSAAPSFFGASRNVVSAAMIDWWTRMMLDGCSMKVMLDLNRVLTETDFRKELPKITVPALIVHGDSDVSAPIDLTGRRTQALIAGSQLKVYEGAAHGLPITHMRQLNADLLAFARGDAI
jgi:non-heme chloroperoxidase